MRNFTKILLSLALTIVCVGVAKANRFLVYNNGTAGANSWDRQVVCRFNAALTTEQQYVVKAKIKVENADGVTEIGFNTPDDTAYPNTKVIYGASIVPTSEFVEYTWYFTTASDWVPTQFIFNTGLYGGKIYVDDVSCKPTNDSSIELVDNGNFNSTDLSKWKTNYNGPSYTIDSDFPNADFVIVYNNGTAGANSWDRQVVCRFNAALTTEQQYVVKAKIKVENADGVTEIGFNTPDDTAYPNTKVIYGASIVPTSEFVEYTWYFTTASDWVPTQFIFNTGLYGGKIYVDDVSCKPTNDSSIELVDNGNFNSTDLSKWKTNYNGPSYTRWDYEVSSTVGTDGFATFSAVKAINVDGIVTAYGAKYDGSKIVLTPVTEIPANTGVIIEATADTYPVPAINSAASIASVNELQVSNGSITGNSSTIYALGKKNDVVGFVKVKSGVAIPAGKAYLTLPATARDFIGFGDEDVTGVNEVKVQKEVRGEYYNLNGQRVAQPTKGLYIVNGKKVIVK